jgi:hypothetical protein
MILSSEEVTGLPFTNSAIHWQDTLACWCSRPCTHDSTATYSARERCYRKQVYSNEQCARIEMKGKYPTFSNVTRLMKKAFARHGLEFSPVSALCGQSIWWRTVLP